MGEFEIKSLNYYFSKKHELSGLKSNNNLIEKFFDIEIFSNILGNYPDISNSDLQILKNVSEKPIQEEIKQFKEKLQQQPRLESFLMDVVKNSCENIDIMWKNFFFYDEFLFKNFSEMMESVKNIKDYKPSLMEIISNFQEKRQNGLSLMQKIKSPLDIYEVITESRLKIEEGTFNHRDFYFPKWDIIQRLKQKSRDDQEINVINWCKETAGLIEPYFKRSLYFISLINLFIVKEKVYIPNKKLENFSVNEVFLKFSKKYNDYENVNDLRHIRNSVNHGDFKWESSQPIEASLIRFKDKNWTKTISFEGVLTIYYKLITFLSTFELVVMNTHLSLLDDSRSLDLIYKDIGNQLFQQFKVPLRDWLEEKEDE